MAVIALPASVRIANIAWTLDRPAQVNRSQWTGRDQVVTNPWHGRWAADVELAPIVGEANVLAWRSFLAKLKGRVNTFRLPAVEKAQNAYVPIVRTTTAAGATTLPLADFPASTIVLLPGQLLTVNDQLLVHTGTATTNASGHVDIGVEPSLRLQAAATTAVEVRTPTCLVAMASSTSGWSVDRGQVYGIKFAAEERY